MRAADKQQGLTLVEVVVVVAVIGIVVLPILSMFITGIQSVSDSRLLLTASLVAQDKVEEVLAAAPSSRSGMNVALRTPASDDRFEFTRLVEAGPNVHLLEVTVEVFWQGTRSERSYKVVTFVDSGS